MEPPYNEEPRHWQNLFAITRFRYIEVLFHVFCCYWGKQNPSLYRGLRYIEVPLYWNVSSWDAVASFIGNTAFSLTLSVSTLRNRRIVLVHQHGRHFIVLNTIRPRWRHVKNALLRLGRFSSPKQSHSSIRENTDPVSRETVKCSMSGSCLTYSTIIRRMLFVISGFRCKSGLSWFHYTSEPPWHQLQSATTDPKHYNFPNKAW